MEANSMRGGATATAFLQRIDWDAVITWVLCFGLVAFLGIDGGGYDPLVYGQVGIGVWWLLLLGVAVGALPRTGLSRLALLALGCLLAFVAWTALSTIWTESVERTWTDLARLLTYLGVFSLVLGLKAPREPQRLVGAVAAAIALIGLLALLSRLHPDWFPHADQTANFLEDSRERISYPLNYWNGLGALLAIGIPLLLHVATTARSLALRALALAALPALALTLFYTLSRGGIIAAAIALGAYLAVADDRVPKLAGLLAAATGAAVLIAVGASEDQLRAGLVNAVARDQGDRVFLIAVAVCAAVGLGGTAIAYAFAERRRPAWSRPSRRLSLAAVGTAALAAVVVALALGAPGRIADAVDEFKGGGNAGAGAGRLSSFAGESRYALWESAVAQNATAPLIGQGSGTFEFWWDRDEGGEEAVQDAHSLYLQTLGELGIVGLLVLLAFVLAVLGGGLREAVRAGPGRRAALAAALAGCLAFCLSAGIDWTWRIPVLPAAMLMLAAALVMPGPPFAAERLVRSLPLRIGLALAGLVAVVAIAIPCAATDLVRESEAEARAGELGPALADARSAASVQPSAASPRLQQALVLELQGRLPAAAAAAREAADREQTNWRPWLVISRLEAKRGNAAAAVAAYREAKSLYPLSPLFDR